MIPKTSWALKVNWVEFSVHNLSGPGHTIDLLIKEQVGGKLKIGDEIYLLKEKTINPDSPAGIFSVGQVVSLTEKSCKLLLDDKRLTNKKRHLKFTALQDDPTIENFEECYKVEWQLNLLSAKTSLRLKLISIKTGSDFDRADSMRCLLAYDECERKQLSIDNSKPVIKAAIETGRLISSVSFKLANFRNLDPRVEAKGFDGVAKIDRDVWNQYYNTIKKEVNLSQLRDDLAHHEFNDPLPPIEEEENEPTSEYLAINDEDTRQTYARRVRGGQSRFRKALITLYDSRCAFTKTIEETVLEACHIISHAKTGDNSLDNGLLLRSDIHVLFDEHLITLANDGITVCVRQDVTAPEYTKLNNSVAQTRPLISERYLNLIRQRNSELNWLK